MTIQGVYGKSMDSNGNTKESWKKEVTAVLKRWGIIDDKTVGRISLDVNCGVREGYWDKKKIE